MKIFINTLLVGIGLLFLSQTVLAAELDTSKIYNCKGMINGKQASVLYDARVVPERECQMGAEMAASFAQGMGKTVSIEEIKKSCINVIKHFIILLICVWLFAVILSQKKF